MDGERPEACSQVLTAGTPRYIRPSATGRTRRAYRVHTRTDCQRIATYAKYSRNTGKIFMLDIYPILLQKVYIKRLTNSTDVLYLEYQESGEPRRGNK